jgi:hypothetical protein
MHTERLRYAVVVMAVKGLALMRPQETRAKGNRFGVTAPALASTIIEVRLFVVDIWAAVWSV